MEAMVKVKDRSMSGMSKLFKICEPILWVGKLTHKTIKLYPKSKIEKRNMYVSRLSEPFCCHGIETYYMLVFLEKAYSSSAHGRDFWISNGSNWITERYADFDYSVLPILFLQNGRETLKLVSLNPFIINI